MKQLCSKVIAFLIILIFTMSPQLVYAKNVKLSNATPKIASLSIYSDNADSTRAYQGDTVSIIFILENEQELPVTSFDVTFDGQAAEVFTWGYGSYIADVTIDDIAPTVGYGELMIHYTLDDGTKILLADNSMSGKGIFLSDKSTLIDVLNDDIELKTRADSDISEADLASICSVFDNDTSTYCELETSGDGKNVAIVLNFKSRRANLSRVEILSRQDEHYSRVNGVHIQGSYDGKSWKKISNNASSNNKWQVLTITTNVNYQYIKITCLSSWYANISEARFFSKDSTDIKNTVPKVTETSICVDGKNTHRALPGDKVTLQFKTDDDVPFYNYSMRALMLGSYCPLSKVAENTYEASTIIPDNLVLDQLHFSIEFLPLSGNTLLLSEDTTDGSYISVSNNENLISLLNGNIDFIDYRGKNSSKTLEQILNLNDDDETTFSTFLSDKKGENAYITLDFKDENTDLSRVEFLPRQDHLQQTTEHINFLASVDGKTWTKIYNEDIKNKNSWQVVYISEFSKYRYLKIINENGKDLDLAELKLFQKEDETANYTHYVNLTTNGINTPNPFLKDFGKWVGSKVYYGAKQNNDLLWRVLNIEEDGSLLLFADDLIESNVLYNHKFINTTWDTSTLRCYLNGYVYHGGIYDPGTVIDYSKKNFIQNYFNATEAAALQTSHLKTNATSSGYPGGEDTDDKVFLLALEDVVNPSYGFTSNASRANPNGDPTDTWWWLRTVGNFSKAYAAAIIPSGELETKGYNISYPYSNANGVRPAFRVGADSVLFNSYSSVAKSKYSIFGSDDSKVESDAYLDGEWKLTLKTTTDSLNAALLESSNIIRSDNMNVTIKHDPASVLSKNAQVSAMLVDEKGTVLYYGKLNEDSNATSSKLMLPSSLKTGNYTIKIFAESLNEGNAVDYGTEFSTLPITITSGVEVEDILGLPQISLANEMIHLDGYVVPRIASFSQIMYYIQDSGDTGATLNNNVITYSNPGTITVVAVVNNGLLYGKPYVKQFTIKVEDRQEPSPTPEQPDQEQPENTPLVKPTPGATPTPEAKPQNTPLAKPTPGVTPTPEAKPQNTPSAKPTPGITPTPEVKPQNTPSAKPTPGVTPTPEAKPQNTPLAKPTPGVTPPAEIKPQNTPLAKPTPGVTPPAETKPENTPVSKPTPGITSPAHTELEPSPSSENLPTMQPEIEDQPDSSPFIKDSSTFEDSNTTSASNGMVPILFFLFICLTIIITFIFKWHIKKDN